MAPLSTEHVILSAAKDLCPRRVRPFPFAEFTLEPSEGLRAAAHALRVTSDGRPPESVAPTIYELRVPNSLLCYDLSDPQYSVEPAMDFA